ncbi:spermidine hydroxycinnamoyl transferase-like [Senna tora]|uniref:Spermidine hydroxycinnamoyl transferase-like n=1 Tax=Senna tora TaxID=362788 RepID=A0A834TKM6_9FABA|nr:spermidine hydroxycinnamoyl transferase-like [Senna tora]
MVTITSSYTVTPSEPTPKACMWLSGSDQSCPWTHTPTIYVYQPPPHQHDAFHTLKHSLQKILVHYYPLAGRLRPIGGGRFEVDCNAKGVTLLQAESPKTLNHYGDFKPDHTITDLIPHIDYTKPIDDIPLIFVQLTTFSCGGLIIGLANSHIMIDGLANSHTMMDGVAAIHFVSSWAKLARGESLLEQDMPFLDRTVLKCPEPLRPPRFDHPEYKDMPLLLGTSDAKEEQKKESTVELLKLTKEQVEKIRKEATESMNLKTAYTRYEAKPYTRFEAVSGHIWRSACKARKHEYNQPTLVRTVGDIRNRLNPPLPPNFVGNAILRTVSRNVRAGEVMSKALGYAAQKVRDAIALVKDEEYLRDQLYLIETVEDVSRLRMGFHSLGCSKTPFFGNPNLVIGTWTSMGVYDADFGWGKPLYMGPGLLGGEGKIFIIPSEDGSLVIAIRLQTAHMPDFKKFLYEDL